MATINYTPHFIHLITYSVNQQSGFVGLALGNSPTTATYYYPAQEPGTDGPLMMLPLSILPVGSQIFALQRCTLRPTNLREMQVALDLVNDVPGDKRRWSQWDWTVALLRAMPRDMIDFGALAAFALNTGLELQ